MNTRVIKTLKILDFDIETRRIGFHNGGRFKPDGCEPIAIAWSWVGSKVTSVMQQPQHSVEEMIAEWREVYDQADIVTGHYIRKFDLPILNGSLFEHGMSTLSQKLTSDTKLDLVSMAGLGLSQENLSVMHHLEEGKFHMSDAGWREAARLTPDGVERTRRRVMDDVKQHKALRLELIEDGVLGKPKLWRP